MAIDTEGSLVGFTVTRPTFIKGSYKIGPLFADSEAITEKLLKAVFEELLQQEDHAPAVCMGAPTEKATWSKTVSLTHVLTNCWEAPALVN